MEKRAGRAGGKGLTGAAAERWRVHELVRAEIHAGNHLHELHPAPPTSQVLQQGCLPASQRQHMALAVDVCDRLLARLHFESRLPDQCCLGMQLLVAVQTLSLRRRGYRSCARPVVLRLFCGCSARDNSEVHDQEERLQTVHTFLCKTCGYPHRVSAGAVHSVAPLTRCC